MDTTLPWKIYHFHSVYSAKVPLEIEPSSRREEPGWSVYYVRLSIHTNAYSRYPVLQISSKQKSHKTGH